MEDKKIRTQTEKLMGLLGRLEAESKLQCHCKEKGYDSSDSNAYSRAAAELLQYEMPADRVSGMAESAILRELRHGNEELKVLLAARSAGKYNEIEEAKSLHAFSSGIDEMLTSEYGFWDKLKDFRNKIAKSILTHRDIRNESSKSIRIIGNSLKSEVLVNVELRPGQVSSQFVSDADGIEIVKGQIFLFNGEKLGGDHVIKFGNNQLIEIIVSDTREGMLTTTKVKWMSKMTKSAARSLGWPLHN